LGVGPTPPPPPFGVWGCWGGGGVGGVGFLGCFFFGFGGGLFGGCGGVVSPTAKKQNEDGVSLSSTDVAPPVPALLRISVVVFKGSSILKESLP